MKTTQKYFRNIYTLKRLTWNSGIRGNWDQDDGRFFFKLSNGAIMNFWKSTGTINFQGPQWAADEMERTLFPDGGIRVPRKEKKSKKNSIPQP
jgi:hypothetical protein